MTGNCGTGKNHLAVSMAKSIVREYLASVEITDVMRLTRAVKTRGAMVVTVPKKTLSSVSHHWIC